jgi:2-polyprenyl-3-methyl-5-hydroxy-6-metoxy-1,4-benzoquinol methylase
MNLSKHPLFLEVKDHSISKETFNLYKDETLDLVYTFPQPSSEKLPRYYESEDYISHTDGKRSLFEKLYQLIKNIALKSKLDLINSSQKTKGSLLDIGAGTGDFLSVARKQGWKTMGFEPNAKAKGIAISKGVSLLDDTNLAEDQSFDVITMWHVLEHVPNIEIQIKEVKRLLKPTGTLFIAVPNFNSYDAKHYGEYWAAYDVPRHLWHFSKKAMKMLFEREALHLEKILPMRFDAFYVALLSEKYKYGKMNFVKAFITGIKSNWKAKQTNEFSSHIYVFKNSK